MKGKKARSGNFHPRYEGGQTPLQRRVPKSGFSKRAFSFEPTSYVNLSKIIYCINKGRLDPANTITIRDLVEAGAVSSPKCGVCLLGRGGSELTESKYGDGKIPPLKLEVSSASKQAIDLVKAAGGTVTCVYRTRLTMRYHLRPEKWVVPPKDPQTPPRRAHSMERLREKGAEVVYVPTEWFKDEANVGRMMRVQRERENRAEKLRAIGEGTRIRPMMARRVDYFVGKVKKKKTKSPISGKGDKSAKAKGKGKLGEKKEGEAKKSEGKGAEKEKSGKKGTEQRKSQSVEAKSKDTSKSEKGTEAKTPKDRAAKEDKKNKEKPQSEAAKKPAKEGKDKKKQEKLSSESSKSKATSDKRSKSLQGKEKPKKGTKG